MFQNSYENIDNMMTLRSSVIYREGGENIFFLFFSFLVKNINRQLKNEENG